MTAAGETTKTREVLLARGGSEGSFQQLAEKLRARGFRVVEEDASPVGAHDTTLAVQLAVGRYDVVLLGVLKSDRGDGSAAPYERVLRDAGAIQASLGPGRVVLLVEETVDRLPDNDFEKIRFPSSRADMVHGDVADKILAATAEPTDQQLEGDEHNLHKQVPVMDQAKSADLRVPWLLVVVVLLAAAIPLAVASCGGGDDEPETEQLIGTPGVLGQAMAIAGRNSAGLAGDGQDAAGSIVSGQSGVADTPAAPAATLGAGGQLLPTTCTIDLTKGLLLVEAIACDGPGGLTIEGWSGPWHNEVIAVAVAEGAVGRVQYEATGAESVDLVGDLVLLDQEAASFGVDQLTVTFSAGGQHVHLFQTTDGTGEFATLTFTLDDGTDS